MSPSHLPLALLCACSPAAGSRSEPPSVLLVTLDTTRADHLSAYAPGHARTPTYDRLAAEGLRFSRAITTAPLTIVSHSSLFTGLYPPCHGVRDNGDFLLSEQENTLAERLHARGYRTLAVTSAVPTQASWGFGQGFDVYHDALGELPDALDWSDRRAAGEVVDDAISLLDGQGPVFAWVHLFDAHWPRRPPEPFRSAYADPYDAAIAYADASVGRLLEIWDRRFPDSVVLVVADHGEGLGEGGEQTHGILLHDGTLRVPLILRGHGAAREAVGRGLVISDPVSMVDVLPTLLALTGLPADPTLPGRDLRRGGSEAPYSEALTGQYGIGLAPLRSLTTNTGRFTEGAWGAWYTTRGEVVETTPDHTQAPAGLAVQLDAIYHTRCGAQAPTANAEMGQQLAALGYLGGDPDAPPGEVDPRDVIDLMPTTWRAQAAIQRGDLASAEQALATLEARIPNTRGVVALRAELAERAGALWTAWELQSALYVQRPTAKVAVRLGRLSGSLGLLEDAEDWYAESLGLQPTNAEAMAGLVAAVWEQGDTERVLALSDRFLAVYPDHVSVAQFRALALLAEGRLDAARDQMEPVLAAQPENPAVLWLAAQVCWARGEADLAISSGQAAWQRDPSDLDVALALSDWLMEVGRAAEATRMLAPLSRTFAGFAQDRVEAAQAALSLSQRSSPPLEAL